MKWFLNSKNIDEIVEASDSWEAFDTLRDRPLADFGSVVEVQPTNETRETAIAIRTSALFGRWGNRVAALYFIGVAKELGLPDTSDTDLPDADA